MACFDGMESIVAALPTKPYRYDSIDRGTVNGDTTLFKYLSMNFPIALTLKLTPQIDNNPSV